MFFVLSLHENAVQIVNPFSRQHHYWTLSCSFHYFLLDHTECSMHATLFGLLLLILLQLLIPFDLVVF